jgi:predicted adenine nucleotide alpha hydrolase (AANH) superfamily ATPase
VYYCNPNIAPYEEYTGRKDEQIRFLQAYGAGSIDFIEESYDHAAFLCEIAGYEDDPEGGARCERCIAMRMRMTAEKASQLRYDYFTTTLSVSPHKNAAFINSCGLELMDSGEDFTARWLVSDFKKQGGYQHSVELSKQYGLYRQDYCGCEFTIH